MKTMFVEVQHPYNPFMSQSVEVVAVADHRRAMDAKNQEIDFLKSKLESSLKLTVAAVEGFVLSMETLNEVLGSKTIPKNGSRK